MKPKRCTWTALLLAAAAVPAIGAADNAAACGAAAPTQVVEAFLSADCLACWQAPETLLGKASLDSTLRLDWIVPSAAGDDAPLATAALPEAVSRLRTPLPATGEQTQVHALPAADGAALQVDSGLAWNGYISLSFDLTLPHTAWPADAVGWVALVERVPAGEDGSPIARQLVRALVGPLLLEPRDGQHEVHHLNAVRLPSNGKAERLAAVGWVERAGGPMLLASASPTLGCKP
jgi:hypothetical protein